MKKAQNNEIKKTKKEGHKCANIQKLEIHFEIFFSLLTFRGIYDII